MRVCQTRIKHKKFNSYKLLDEQQQSDNADGVAADGDKDKLAIDNESR